MKLKLLVAIVFAVSLVAFSAPQQSKPWTVPADYKSKANTKKDDKANTEKVGKAFYARACASCHKADGTGTAKTGTVNFAKGFGTHTDGEILYRAFYTKGHEFDKKVPTDDQKWLVVNYIKSLKK